MMEKENLHFAGADWFLAASDISEDLYDALISCGGSGDSRPQVDYVMAAFDVTGEEGDCRDYLRGYGAWDDEELADHERNLGRLVWLAGCDLAEQGEAYFCAYG